MRIAVPTEGNDVSPHFGRSPSFTLAEVEEGSLRSSRVLPTPGQGHEAIFPFLLEQGVTCVIASGMGARAREQLSRSGIRILLGATGPVSRVLESFLAGTLEQEAVPPEEGCHGEESHGRGGAGPHGCRHS